MIVVGAGHDHFPPLDLHHGPFILLNRSEIRVKTMGFDLIGAGERPAFLEKVNGFVFGFVYGVVLRLTHWVTSLARVHGTMDESLRDSLA
jgi:hypothetical protein